MVGFFLRASKNLDYIIHQKKWAQQARVERNNSSTVGMNCNCEQYSGHSRSCGGDSGHRAVLLWRRPASFQSPSLWVKTQQPQSSSFLFIVFFRRQKEFELLCETEILLLNTGNRYKVVPLSTAKQNTAVSWTLPIGRLFANSVPWPGETGEPFQTLLLS